MLSSFSGPKNAPAANLVSSKEVSYTHFVFRYDYQDWKVWMVPECKVGIQGAIGKFNSMIDFLWGCNHSGLQHHCLKREKTDNNVMSGFQS